MGQLLNFWNEMAKWAFQSMSGAFRVVPERR